MKLKAKILVSLLIITSIAGNARAGSTKLRGWLEDKLSISATGYKPGDTRELRLILDSKINPVMSFNSHLYGKVFLGEDVTDEKYAEALIDRAFLSLDFSKTRIRVGRQRLAWGAGFIWNPTDIFNEVNLTDRNYTRKGKDAIEMNYYPGDTSEVTCLVTFSTATLLQCDNLAIRGKTNIQGYDITFSIISQASGKIDLLGADLAGTVENLFGIRMEQLYDINSRRQDLSIGVDYSLNEYIYLFAEYSRNELNYYDLLKNYFYIGMSDTINELLTFSAGLMVDGNPLSMLLSTNFGYSLSNDTDITLSLNFTTQGLLNTHYVKLRFYF